MSEKILLVIISVFVLVIVSGIVYLFIASSDSDGDGNSILGSEDGATVGGDPTVVSDIPEPDTEPGLERAGPDRIERIETVKPQTPTGVLEGRVIDEQGKPIAGVEMTLFKAIPAMPLNKRLPTHLQATTDAGGSYRLDSVPVGHQYALLAQAEQYAETEMDGLGVGPDQTVNVADFILESGITLSGTVTTADGLPLADVSVEVVDKMKQMAEMPRSVFTRTLRTDGNGQYHFACLSARQYEVSFTAPGFRLLTVTQNFILAGQEENERTLDVQLDESGLTIQGIVRGPGSRGIKNAEVQALFNKPGDNAHFTTTANTDGSGSFLLTGLSEGHYTLLVSASGFFQNEFVAAEAGDTAVEINLLPTGSVEGTVQAAGKLPKKYEIHINKFTASVRVNGQNRIPSIQAGPKETFRYTDLLPGTYVFLVKASGFAQTRSDEVEVRSGETTPGISVELYHGGTIEGTVLDRNGKPISGIQISLMDKTYNPALPFEDFFMVPPEQEKSTKSSTKGKFKLEHVRAGTYVLKLAGKSVASKVVKDVVVVEEQTLKLGQIKLSRGGGIKGVAYGADGAPARGAKVTAVSAEAGNRKTVTTDNKGAFKIEALAPGEYLVSLTPKDFWAALKYKSSVTVYVEENRTSQVDVITVEAERNRGEELIEEP